MKIKTLSVLAGIGAPLIATASAPAGFVGIECVIKPNSYGLWVVRVYAEFDRPGEDVMQAVAGTPDSPLHIEVHGGTFYNHAFGTDRPPSTGLVAVFPSLAFDSFVTIGVTAVGPNGQPADSMIITPGFPGISGTQLHTTSSGWAITPDEPAADPFNQNFVAGNGMVLIGQFSTADGGDVEGTILLQYVSNGVVATSVEYFHEIIPAPGIVALFGIAGLVGARRRRQSVGR